MKTSCTQGEDLSEGKEKYKHEPFTMGKEVSRFEYGGLWSGHALGSDHNSQTDARGESPACVSARERWAVGCAEVCRRYDDQSRLNRVQASGPAKGIGPLPSWSSMARRKGGIMNAGSVVGWLLEHVLDVVAKLMHYRQLYEEMEQDLARIHADVDAAIQHLRDLERGKSNASG